MDHFLQAEMASKQHDDTALTPLSTFCNMCTCPYSLKLVLLFVQQSTVDVHRQQEPGQFHLRLPGVEHHHLRRTDS